MRVIRVPHAGREPDTAVVEWETMTNIVTPYLRVVLRLTDSRLEVEWPVAALGIVAVRRTCFQAPLTEVQSIRLTHLVAPGRLALALVLALVGPVVRLPPPAAAALAAGAILLVLVGLVAAIEIRATRHQATVPVCWLRRRYVEEFMGEARRRTAALGRTAP